MAQKFVMKDRSRDADGHKESSHMIRDPRQKIANAQYEPKKKRAQRSKITKLGKKTVSMNDKGVRTRVLRSSLNKF